MKTKVYIDGYHGSKAVCWDNINSVLCWKAGVGNNSATELIEDLLPLDRVPDRNGIAWLHIVQPETALRALSDNRYRDNTSDSFKQ